MNTERLHATLIYLALQWGFYFLLVYVIFSNNTGAAIYSMMVVEPLIFPILYYVIIGTIFHISTTKNTDYLIQLAMYLVFNVICSFVFSILVSELSKPHYDSFDWSGVMEALFGIFSTISFFIVTAVKKILEVFQRFIR